MKKLTIATAIVAAFGSSLASAQTSVSLYGIADAGVSGVDRGDNAAGASLSNFQVTSGVQSASRFGIRGTEDLGNGLKAIFAAEAAWNVDEGTGDTGGALSFGRRSVVGLGGSYGTLLLGRDYLPAFHAYQVSDVFGHGLWGTAYLYGRSNGFTPRSSNAIHYTSPTWNGLVVRASFGASERYQDPKSAGNVGALSMVFTSGPLAFSTYYQQIRAGTGTPVSGWDKRQEYGIGLAYRMNTFRVAGGWARSALPANQTNFDAWHLGVGVRAGAGEVLVGYQRLTTEGDRNAALGGTAGVKGKANVYGIAYTHPMSKRTNLYASFGYTDNGSGSAFGLASNAQTIAPAAPGEKVKALGVGLRHTF